MRKKLFSLAALALGIACIPPGAMAWENLKKPSCEPDYNIVEEVHYKEVVKKFCREVPDVKKKVKWVYDCITQDYCLPTCPCPLHGLTHHHGCDSCKTCTGCGKPRTKTVLVKKMVVEECPTIKCVVETVVEKIPIVIHRKVPCAIPPQSPSGIILPGLIQPDAKPELIPAPKGAFMPPATSQSDPNSLPPMGLKVPTPAPTLPELPQ